MSYYIIAIRMDNRTGNSLKLQDTLTRNGCNIKSRLGLHEADAETCANDGLIVLQPNGTKTEIDGLMDDLNKLEGIRAKLIDLN